MDLQIPPIAIPKRHLTARKGEYVLQKPEPSDRTEQVMRLTITMKRRTSAVVFEDVILDASTARWTSVAAT